MRALAILAVLSIAALSDAITQQLPVQPGQQVRVTAHTHDLRRTPVTFFAVRSDSLHVQYVRKRLDHARVITDSLHLAMPLSAVTKLEVPAGRRSNWDKGARTGAITGGVLGFIIGGLFAACDDPWGCPTTGGDKVGTVVLGSVIFGFAGGLVGAMIGEMSHRDTWREVPLDRFRVSVVPQRDGFGIGARIAF